MNYLIEAQDLNMLNAKNHSSLNSDQDPALAAQ